MDSLSSGQDLLAPHEHVVRVRVLRVLRVRHRVERTNSQGVFVLQRKQAVFNKGPQLSELARNNLKISKEKATEIQQIIIFL